MSARFQYLPLMPATIPGGTLPPWLDISSSDRMEMHVLQRGLVDQFQAVLGDLEPAERPISREGIGECGTKAIMRDCLTCGANFAAVDGSGHPLTEICSRSVDPCPRCGIDQLFASLRLALSPLPPFLAGYRFVAGVPSEALADVRYLSRVNTGFYRFRTANRIASGLTVRALRLGPDGQSFVATYIVGVPLGTRVPLEFSGFEVEPLAITTRDGFFAASAIEHLKGLRSLISGSALKAYVSATAHYPAFRTFGAWRDVQPTAADERVWTRAPLGSHRCPDCGSARHRAAPSAPLRDLDVSRDGRKIYWRPRKRRGR